MEDNIITVSLKPFVTTKEMLDDIYSNEKYDQPFLIKVKSGSYHSVRLEWQQGWSVGYNFTNGDYIIHLDHITHIEVRL